MNDSVTNPTNATAVGCTDLADETHAGTIAGRSIPALDGIRGIAILLVLAYHYVFFLPESTPWHLRRIFDYGWMGVDLFFVLSGFLITGIRLNTRDTQNYFRSFYARRALRIFPLYYLVLSLVLIGAHLLTPYPAGLPRPGSRWLYFVYLQNWSILQPGVGTVHRPISDIFGRWR